jgi:hypothetical protein
MNQRELKNSGGRLDALDQEDRDVAALLGALPRVEAPRNFEFGVKARIAKGSPARNTTVPFFKVAAPLGLLFAVAGLGIFYGTLPAGDDNQTAQAPVTAEAPVVAARTETAVLPPSVTVVPETAPPSAAKAERASIEPRKVSPSPVRQAVNTRTADRSVGGSVDSSLGSANTILPRGLDSANPRNANINGNGAGAQIPVRDIFEMLGIDAEFVDTGWKVRSLMVNSIASRAKVRLGDIVEAIDGNPLKGSSTPRGSVTVLTILRDGKSINLNLK